MTITIGLDASVTIYWRS